MLVVVTGHRPDAGAAGLLHSNGSDGAKREGLRAAHRRQFHKEWRLAGRARPLASIAIADEAPETQYLYPEFLLF